MHKNGNLNANSISLKQALHFAWITFKNRFALFVAILLTFLGAWVLLEIIVILGQPLGIVLWAAAHLSFFFAFAYFQLGFLQICLTLSAGRVPSYADLFRPTASVTVFLIGQIGYFLMVVAGLLLFFIPGLYLATRYALFAFSLLNEQRDLKRSFQHSALIGKGKQGYLLMLLALLFLFNLLGAGLLGLGLFVSIPISVLVLTHFYQQLNANTRI